MVRIRRPFGDALISIAGLTMLLGVLVSVDERVRDQVSLRMAGGRAQEELTGAGTRARDLASVMYEAVRDQSIEHAPMVIFVGAAGALVIFMLRT